MATFDRQVQLRMPSDDFERIREHAEQTVNIEQFGNPGRVAWWIRLAILEKAAREKLTLEVLPDVIRTREAAHRAA